MCCPGFCHGPSSPSPAPPSPSPATALTITATALAVTCHRPRHAVTAAVLAITATALATTVLRVLLVQELRRSLYSKATSDAIYENDDKCGSHWQQLPVSEGGRISKGLEGNTYEFAVQANVVCGDGGILRFAVVPKNVQTGGNFGLTNLIVTIDAAHRANRLPLHVRRMVRHTDGGGDNVSYVTHVVHWLLVYLGIFDEIVWFRFEAGHSHTEIADRLFGIMKKLFETDDRTRAQRLATFPELFEKLEKEFDACPEAKLFEYDFANWDFEAWLRGMVNEDTGHNLFEKGMARYSFDNVFRYYYVGPELHEHGGVKVVYKDRLSRTATALDAEWAPLEEKTRPAPSDRPGPPTKVNVTTEKGIVFVQHPPSLKKAAPLEDFAERVPNKQPSYKIEAMLKQMAKVDGMSTSEVREWRALQAMQARPHAYALPVLPHTEVLTGAEDTSSWLPVGAEHRSTFTGTPANLKEMLKRLRRFDRPLITWNIFDDEPPSSWPTGEGAAAPSGRADGYVSNASNAERRDPSAANSVSHLLRPDSERRREDSELLEKQWAEEQDNRVTELEKDRFYLIRTESADEPWMKLAVVQFKVHEDTTEHFYWYGRAGAQRNKKWVQTPSFAPWPDIEHQAEHAIPADVKMAMLLVPVDWTTAQDAASMVRGFLIKGEWRRKIELFARISRLGEDSLVDDSALEPRPAAAASSKKRAPAPKPQPEAAKRPKDLAATSQPKAKAATRPKRKGRGT